MRRRSGCPFAAYGHAMKLQRAHLVLLVLGIVFVLAGVLVGPPIIDRSAHSYAKAINDVEHAALSPRDGNTLLGAGVALIITAIALHLTATVRMSITVTPRNPRP